ncbi:MAG: hypothetical protein JST50_00890 [Bacteroidetes bacterium]|jgi:hypothetical protein|nr:hypothetical protein [Bacteroidota bacterium]
MKNNIIVLFIACLSVALFSSCSKEALAPAPQPVKGSSTLNPAKDNVSPVTTSDPILGHINTAVTLSGQWKLVKDSVAYSDGLGQNSPSSDVYNGKAADYFEFTSDGKLYIQENGLVDTANYTINTDKSITVNYLVYNSLKVASYGSIITNFQQVNLTGTSVTLTSSVVAPGGVQSRVIALKR